MHACGSASSTSATANGRLRIGSSARMSTRSICRSISGSRLSGRKPLTPPAPAIFANYANTQTQAIAALDSLVHAAIFNSVHRPLIFAAVHDMMRETVKAFIIRGWLLYLPPHFEEKRAEVLHA